MVDVGAEDATAKDVECIINATDHVSEEGLHMQGCGHMYRLGTEHKHSTP